MNLLITGGLGSLGNGSKSGLITCYGLGDAGTPEPGECAPLRLYTFELYADRIVLVMSANVLLDGPALVPSNWLFVTSATPIACTSIAVSGVHVTLYISEPTTAASYTLNIPHTGILDPLSNQYEGPYSIAFSGLGQAPGISMTRSIDARLLDVIFSEPVLAEDALVPANYVVTPNLTVTAVTKITDRQYRLTTSKQTENAVYTCEAINIRDLASNEIAH